MSGESTPSGNVGWSKLSDMKTKIDELKTAGDVICLLGNLIASRLMPASTVYATFSGFYLGILKSI